VIDVDADVRWEEEEGVEEVVVAMVIIVLLGRVAESWHFSPGRNTMLRHGLRTENMARLSRGCFNHDIVLVFKRGGGYWIVHFVISFVFTNLR
jgi:hypothetical protein